ncbi:MAG: MFS transporter [Clostridiales bacterium]|jgi:Na+/melibiose symporter-like transporter|nr:MFS transporter [Clostridiales bacterium]
MLRNDGAVGGKERFFAAIGDFFGGGAGSMITTIYVVYLAMNGLGPGGAASIVMIAKIWDAVTDPMMGVISDNTRSKYGRRRPYIFAGGLLVMLSFALLFMPLYEVKNGAFVYVFYLFAYLVFSTVSTVISVPYSALLSEISTDPNERNRVNTVRLVVSMLSSAISAGVPIFLVETLRDREMSVDSFSLMMIFGFGLLYAVPLVLCAAFSKERVPMPMEKTVFSIKEFFKPLKLKAFVYLVVMYFSAFTCMDLITTNIIYFMDYGVEFKIGGGSGAFLILAAIMASYAAMIPLHNKLMRTKSKALLFRAGIPLYIAGIVFLCLYPKEWNQYPLFLVAAAIGVGMSGCQLLPWYIFPDVVDLGELKFGKRNSGSFSGIMTFIRKTTAAVAIGVSGWVLELAGFVVPTTDAATGFVTDSAQTAEAVLGLRLVIMIPIILLTSAAFIFSTKLKISPERSKLVERALILRRGGGGADEMTENDEVEIGKIKKDCF